MTARPLATATTTLLFALAAALEAAGAPVTSAPLLAPRAQKTEKPKQQGISRRTLLLATLLPLLFLVLIGASLCACEVRSVSWSLAAAVVSASA